MIAAHSLASLRVARIAHVVRPAAIRPPVVASPRAQRIAAMSTSSPVEALVPDPNQSSIRLPWSRRSESAEPFQQDPAWTPRVFSAKSQSKADNAKRKKLKVSRDKFGEAPIFHDICEILGEEKYYGRIEGGREFATDLEVNAAVICRIERLTANGDGLALAPSGDWVIAVPCVVPGEEVKVRIKSNERLHSRGELLRIMEKTDEGNAVQRRDDFVKCKYYGQCSGCQYQHIDYDAQLTLKQDVVRRAFSNYSKLEEGQIPEIGPTLASPLQYGYRTKLTPHFNLPSFIRNARRGNGKTSRGGPPAASTSTFREGTDEGSARPAPLSASVPDFPIGFDNLATKKVMDIEECTIATQTINRALPAERKKVRDAIHMYRNGATLLLRDSLKSFDSYAEDQMVMSADGKEATEPPQFDTEVVIDHKATVRERVTTTLFHSPANAFFQNNRAILPHLLSYIEEAIKANPPATASAERFLVDTYCGSGLFALCLAPLFARVSGVEVSKDSITHAKHNAHINGIANTEFLAGDAEEIFGKIDFPRDQTTVVIDPPRRGCDLAFMRQLLTLGPHLIVYVSCNVHTQARDVGMMVNGLTPYSPKGARSAMEATAPARRPTFVYDIVSVRGADLFPQTHHVEGVCILKRRDAPADALVEEQTV